jgi:hypothetical protein
MFVSAFEKKKRNIIISINKTVSLYKNLKIKTKHINAMKSTSLSVFL